MPDWLPVKHIKNEMILIFFGTLIPRCSILIDCPSLRVIKDVMTHKINGRRANMGQELRAIGKKIAGALVYHNFQLFRDKIQFEDRAGLNSAEE